MGFPTKVWYSIIFPKWLELKNITVRYPCIGTVRALMRTYSANWPMIETSPEKVSAHNNNFILFSRSSNQGVDFFFFFFLPSARSFSMWKCTDITRSAPLLVQWRRNCCIVGITGTWQISPSKMRTDAMFRSRTNAEKLCNLGVDVCMAYFIQFNCSLHKFSNLIRSYHM